MRDPTDSELVNWAELCSSTVAVRRWSNDRAGKGTLILISSRLIADVTFHGAPLPDHIRIALLEQHFIEKEKNRDA